MNAKCKTAKGAMRMADGGEVSPWSIKGVYNRLTTPPPATRLTPVASVQQIAPVAPPVQTPPQPQSAISQYAGMTALQRREKEAGLKDGGQLKTGKGGAVPGKGMGDKIPAKYEPGEFVVSNAMMSAEPGLQEHLHQLRIKTLASQGKTPAQADAGRFKRGAIRALAGFDPTEGDRQKAYLDAQKKVSDLAPSYFTQSTPTTAQNLEQAKQAANEAYKNIYSAKPSVGLPVSPTLSPSTPVRAAAPAISKPAAALSLAGDATLPGQDPGRVAQLAQVPTLNGQEGSPVSGAPGVSKFVENGKTLYSNVPDNTTLMNRGAIRPQNMDAAQALSDRYQAQAAQVAEPVGGAQGATVLPDTGGYGLLDKGYQERRSAGMALSSITASKEEKAAALRALDNLDRRDMNAANNANAITRQGMTDQTTRRGQDITASGQASTATDRGAIRKLAEQRFGLESQKAGNENTAAGFKSRAAQRIEDLQTAYEKAPPEQKSAIAEQLRVLTGKDKPAQWKAIALQGSTDSMGNKTEGVLAGVNEQTGEVRRLDQGKEQALPPGMKKQVGTANGKPVYEDANGKRFQ